LAARFFFLPPFLALALGRDLLAFLRALGREGFRRFLLLAGAGSSIIGAGCGEGAEGGGYSGSIMPGPVQLLSEKSLGSSIRSLLRWLSVGVAYSLSGEPVPASDAARGPAARRCGAVCAVRTLRAAPAQVSPLGGQSRAYARAVAGYQSTAPAFSSLQKWDKLA